MSTTVRDEDILSYDPFLGDETDATPLKDALVFARKEHECHTCGETIQPKERIRSRTERNNEDKTLETFRFCWLCCVAMATSDEDNEEAIEARIANKK